MPYLRVSASGSVSSWRRWLSAVREEAAERARANQAAPLIEIDGNAPPEAPSVKLLAAPGEGSEADKPATSEPEIQSGASGQDSEQSGREQS